MMRGVFRDPFDKFGSQAAAAGIEKEVVSGGIEQIESFLTHPDTSLLIDVDHPKISFLLRVVEVMGKMLSHRVVTIQTAVIRAEPQFTVLIFCHRYDVITGEAGLTGWICQDAMKPAR